MAKCTIGGKLKGEWSVVLVLLHKHGSGYMMVACVKRRMFNQL